MADPAALLALPGLIRAARNCAVEHAPNDSASGTMVSGLMVLLSGAEMVAEGLAQLVRLYGHEPATEAPQQILAPLTGHAEPLVPLRGGDPRLPPGRNHP